MAPTLPRVSCGIVQRVNAELALQIENRKLGKDGALAQIQEIDTWYVPAKTPLPIIASNKDNSHLVSPVLGLGSDPVENRRSCSRRFFLSFPHLAGAIPAGFVVAGPSVGAAIANGSGGSDTVKETMLFPVDISEDDAKAAIEALGVHIIAYFRKQFFQKRAALRRRCGHTDVVNASSSDDEKKQHDDDDAGSVAIHRTSKAVTFSLGAGETVKVVLARYATIAEVLYDTFDVGSDALAFDGRDVWMTPIGRLAVETGLNVVDPTGVRLANYERRLAAAFGLGFAIALPQLDVDKAKRLKALPRLVLGEPNFRWVGEARFLTSSVAFADDASIDDDDDDDDGGAAPLAFRNACVLMGMSSDDIVYSGFVKSESSRSVAEATHLMDELSLSVALRNLIDAGDADDRITNLLGEKTVSTLRRLGVDARAHAFVEVARSLISALPKTELPFCVPGYLPAPQKTPTEDDLKAWYGDAFLGPPVATAAAANFADGGGEGVLCDDGGGDGDGDQDVDESTRLKDLIAKLQARLDAITAK